MKSPKISRRRYACCPNAETALVKVRELSEHATLRPATRVLWCIPVQAGRPLSPVPQWKRDWIRIQELSK